MCGFCVRWLNCKQIGGAPKLQEVSDRLNCNLSTASYAARHKSNYYKYTCERDTAIFWRIFRIGSDLKTLAGDGFNLWLWAVRVRCGLGQPMSAHVLSGNLFMNVCKRCVVEILVEYLLGSSQFPHFSSHFQVSVDQLTLFDWVTCSWYNNMPAV